MEGNCNHVSLLKDIAKGEPATRCHLHMSGEGMDDTGINFRLLLGCFTLVKLVPYESREQSAVLSKEEARGNK